MEVEGEGQHTAFIDDAVIWWDPAQPSADPAEVHSVQFALPANMSAAYDFDFCISEVVVIAD